MDKETLSQYSWLIITAIVLVLMIGIAIPFADDIAAAIKGIPDEIVNSDEVDTTPHEHVYVNQVSKSRYLASEASCISPARYYLSCTCGEAGTETFEYGFTNANAHVGEQEKEYAPIDAVEHSKKTICSSCNAVITNITEEHVLEENICTLCGYGDAHEHDYSVELADEAFIVSAATCTTPAIYYRSCSCGEVGTETFSFGEALGHNYTSSVTKAATCTETGVRTYTCENDASHTYTEEIAKVAHAEGTRNEVTAPTCTEKGYTTYITYCTVCGEEISRTVSDYTESLGHNYTSSITKEASCTEAGVLTYTCSCGDSYTEEIPKKAHTPGAEATCDTAQTCTACGKELAAALGHDYEEIKSYTEPTCTTDGEFEYRYICSVCGDEDLEAYWTETDIDSALGHDYTSAVTKEATCTETGILTYTCEACGDAYTEDIDALGHKDTNTDHVCDNGCGIYQGTHEDGADADHLCDYGCKEIADEGCYDTIVDGKCDECGAEIVHDCADASNDGDHKCDSCGKDNITSHTYTDGEYETDKDDHWQVCTECGAKSNSVEHDWLGESCDYVDPTCNDDGYWNWALWCEECGYRDEWVDYDYGSALGHTYPEGEYETNENEHWQVCTVCRNESAHESHNVDTKSVATEPTCTDQGYTTHTTSCTVCQAVLEEEITDWKDPKHTYDQTNTSDEYLKSKANCVALAQYYYSCTCGARGTETFEHGEVDSSYHASGIIISYVYVNNDSHELRGTCSSCDAITASGMTVAHINSDGDSTCDLCEGHIHNYQEIVTEGALLGPASCCRSAIYYKSCSCGAVQYNLNDTFSYGEKNPDVHGVYTGSYLVKAGTIVKYEFLDDTYHVARTCCDCCGAQLSAFSQAHDEGGYENCGICGGGDHVCSFVSSADGATEAYLATEATCQSPATYYFRCETCGEKGTSTFEYGSVGSHVYDQKTITTTYLKSNATCTSAAVYYYSCSCGAKGTTTFTSGSALAHTYNQKVTTSTYLKSNATCTSAAVYYYSCSCGAKGTATFTSGSAPGHTYNKKVTTSTYLKSNATCTSAAVYYYSCSCGAKGTTTFTSGSALGHTTVDSKYCCTRCRTLVAGLYETGTDNLAYSWDELVNMGAIITDSSTLTGSTPSLLAGDLVISNNILSLSGGALKGCEYLTGLLIPTSVTDISGTALGGCSALKKIILPIVPNISEEKHSIKYIFGSLTTSGIGSGMVGYAVPNTLEEIIITGGEIYSCTFEDCTTVNRIEIQVPISEIITDAFAYSGAREIVLSEGTEYIRANSFYMCSNLETIYIPHSIKQIEDSAFVGVAGAITVVYNGTKEEWNQVDWSGPDDIGLCNIRTVICTDGTIEY